jgi:hypothetical protein
MLLPPKVDQALPARVQPASHQRWQCIGDSLSPPGGAYIPFKFLLSGRRFWFLILAQLKFEIFSILQHRPSQPRVLRRDGYHRAP